MTKLKILALPFFLIHFSFLNKLTDDVLSKKYLDYSYDKNWELDIQILDEIIESNSNVANTYFVSDLAKTNLKTKINLASIFRDLGKTNRNIIL